MNSVKNIVIFLFAELLTDLILYQTNYTVSLEFIEWIKMKLIIIYVCFFDSEIILCGALNGLYLNGWVATKDAHFSMISHKNWSTFTILVLANLSLILDIQWPRSWLQEALERKNASSSQHHSWTHKIWSNIITVCNHWYEFWVLHYHKIIFDTKHPHILLLEIDLCGVVGVDKT